MPALTFDGYIPSHREHGTKKRQPRVSSTSRALIIGSLKADDGSCEVEDLQGWNARRESRESTEGWSIRCQWAGRPRGREDGQQLKYLLYTCEDQS